MAKINEKIFQEKVLKSKKAGKVILIIAISFFVIPIIIMAIVGHSDTPKDFSGLEGLMQMSIPLFIISAFLFLNKSLIRKRMKMESDSEELRQAQIHALKRGKSGTVIQQVQRTGCCAVGLIPSSLILLTAMIYSNKNLAYFFIDFHKRKTSPIINKMHFKCGFTPSCSEYSKIAIKKYGVLQGGFKSLWRIFRCNPFNKSKGYDYP